MEPVHDDQEFRELPINRAIVLENARCVYCGTSFATVAATKDHVVGRRFVPKGTLQGWWNLIVRACEACNRKKADLEDDISAITMAPDAAGKYAADDPGLRTEAERKAQRSFSRRTRKPVAQSAEKLSVKGSHGPISFTAQFVSPPQLEPGRAYELARLQMIAFFYFLTYREHEGEGGWWRGGFYPVMDALKSDWGNSVLAGFADAVIEWDPRFVAAGAGGFYKALIRRHPSAECWSWALEWNKKYRIVGFFGELAAAQEIADRLPRLQAHTIYEAPNSFLRYRPEVTLREEEDRLFAWGHNTL